MFFLAGTYFLLLLISGTLSEITCPSGNVAVPEGFSNRDGIYYQFSQTTATFFNAYQDCQSKGAKLGTVQTEPQFKLHNWIATNERKDLWTDLLNPKRCQSGDCSAQLEWLDGNKYDPSAMPWLTWGMDVTSGKPCTYVDTSTSPFTIKDGCLTSRHYLCIFDCSSAVKPKCKHGDVAPSGYNQFRSHFYRHLPRGNNLPQKTATCINDGTRLAEFRTEEAYENIRMLSEMSDSTIFVGLDGVYLNTCFSFPECEPYLTWLDGLTPFKAEPWMIYGIIADVKQNCHRFWHTDFKVADCNEGPLRAPDQAFCDFQCELVICMNPSNNITNGVYNGLPDWKFLTGSTAE